MKVNWDYIAGFFDGEGSLVYYRKKENRWGRAIKFMIAQKDPSILKKIQRFLMKEGCIHVGIYGNKSGFTGGPCHNLVVQNKHDLSIILNNLKGRVYVKSKKLNKMLKIISQTNWLGQERYMPSEKNNILRLWDTGKSIKEISKGLKIKYHSADYIIRNNRGICIRKDRVEEVRKLAQKNKERVLSYRQICKLFKIKTIQLNSTIICHNIIKKIGRNKYIVTEVENDILPYPKV
jgi:DNA-binding CsgD family transcriptional regulator